MPRIPYLPEDMAAPADLVDAIRARRGGKLYNLDRVLLRSAPFATGWNAFLGRVRRELTIPAKSRELAICLVALLNRANYEYVHHLPEFVSAGASEEEVAALATLDDPNADVSMFTEKDRAVIALTRELTRECVVSDVTFALAEAAFPDPSELVELVGVISAYNMVSRFLTAFSIEPE